MLAVFKKELKTYFLTPLGYVFIAVFMALFSTVFYSMIFNATAGYTTIAKFEYVIANSIVILTFITPVLTMRMFAEEKMAGTDQLLFTSPRSIVGIVFGKFLAAAAVIVITIAITMIYFFILTKFGDPSLKVALVASLGFFMIALAYVSFGMFASSVAPNQLIAAIITIGFFVVTSFFDTTSSGTMSTISLMGMYQKFPLGIISLQEVIGYLSFIGLFLLLTMIILQRRKSVK